MSEKRSKIKRTAAKKIKCAVDRKTGAITPNHGDDEATLVSETELIAVYQAPVVRFVEKVGDGPEKIEIPREVGGQVFTLPKPAHPGQPKSEAKPAAAPRPPA